jgi:hypothetical protein
MNYFLTTAIVNKIYYENMKTFKDLEFIPHPSGTGKIARMEFKKGHGISVVQGHIFLGESDLYDMAETFNGELVTATNIMEVTEEQITKKMIELQEL